MEREIHVGCVLWAAKMLKKMSGLGWQLLWVSIKDDERHNMNPNHSFEDEFEQYCHLRRHSDLEKPCDHCCPLYWRLLVRNYKHCQIQKPTLTVHLLSFEPSQLRVRLGDYDFKKVMIFKSFFLHLFDMFWGFVLTSLWLWEAWTHQIGCFFKFCKRGGAFFD